LGISSWLGSSTVRSCEVRLMNTLATGAKPRFIPARAAWQGIAEIGAKRSGTASLGEVRERSTGAVARGAQQKGR
jgi:hypothetical protein